LLRGRGGRARRWALGLCGVNSETDLEGRFFVYVKGGDANEQDRATNISAKGNRSMMTQVQLSKRMEVQKE